MLWNELPLPDNAVAARLGCTRQQVINLRMAARKRLAHRLADAKLISAPIAPSRNMTVPPTHVTDADIERFRRRQLPGDALVPFADHLASCGDCRRRVAERSDVAAASGSLQEALGIGGDDHVAESEIQAFVDGGLDTDRRGEISAHLAQCPACAEEVRDLQGFAAQLSRPGRFHTTVGLWRSRGGSRTRPGRRIHAAVAHAKPAAGRRTHGCDRPGDARQPRLSRGRRSVGTRGQRSRSGCATARTPVAAVDAVGVERSPRRAVGFCRRLPRFTWSRQSARSCSARVRRCSGRLSPEPRPTSSRCRISPLVKP